MNGINCPVCDKPSEWLSTTNIWCYYCPDHGRFDSVGQFKDSERVKNEHEILEKENDQRRSS